MHQTIVATIGNDAGALNRVVGLLRRKGFHLESVALARGEGEAIRRATFVVEVEDTGQLLSQLRRLIDVIDVEALPPDSPFERETALIGVHASAAVRPEIVALCSVFSARVLDVGAASMVIEITGSRSGLDRFLELIRPYGLAAVARTGPIALRRDAVAHHIDARSRAPHDSLTANALAG